MLNVRKLCNRCPELEKIIEKMYWMWNIYNRWSECEKNLGELYWMSEYFEGDLMNVKKL